MGNRERDNEPDNVLLGDDGRARVLDFGLARVLDRPESASQPTVAPSGQRASEERLTQLGAIMGTPGYMSPEQVRSADADARSDQFSFCAALYEALYQRLPFAGETFEAYSQEVLAGRLLPPPPSEVPIAVEQALRRGLATSPEQRFPSMTELIRALESGLHPDSESASTRRANRRFRLLLVVMTAITAGGGLRNGFERGERNMLHALLMMCGLMLSTLVVLLILRRPLLRRTSYRRMAYSFVVITAYLLLGRLFGYVQGMDLGRYTPLEMLAVTALIILEAPNASSQYRWLAALALGGAVVTLGKPELSVLILTVIYPVLAVAGAYYRLTQPAREQGAAGAKEPERP